MDRAIGFISTVTEILLYFFYLAGEKRLRNVTFDVPGHS